VQYRVRVVFWGHNTWFVVGLIGMVFLEFWKSHLSVWLHKCQFCSMIIRYITQFVTKA